MKRLACIAALGLPLCAVLLSQAFTGSISGIVSDPTGAVVTGVAITVTEIDRNVRFKSASNETGFYVVPSLPPGNYRVEAEASGFRRFTLGKLPLATQQKATVDITLALGPVTENVEVTGQAQMVEASTSTLSAVVENKRILDLPLNGRNIFQLTGLIPGVFYTSQLGGDDQSFRANQFSVNGGQPGNTEVLIDGVTATASDELSNMNSTSAVPSVEGIQEFRIQTNSFSAEYGRSGGGVVTMATKSGANTPHGSLFYFHRNSEFDANSFFANRSGQALRNFKRHQFGGSLGGPIYLPKVYNGRNRSFFFFTYEGMRRVTPSFTQHTVPTDLERQGDFSQTFNPAGQIRVVYDPFTTRPDPQNPAKFIRDPFGGNRVPQSMMDPVALNAQKYYPAATAAGEPFTRQRNFVKMMSNKEPQDRFEMKIDHNLSDSRRVFGRYTLMNFKYGKPNVWGNIADPYCCSIMNQRLQNAALDYTDSLNSSTVLNVRLGFSRPVGNRLPVSYGFQVRNLGLPEAIDRIANASVFPTIQIDDMTQMGPDAGDIYMSNRTTYMALANLSKVVGRQSLKFGYDMRFNFVNAGQLQRPVGLYSFSRSLTQGPDPRTPTQTGGVGYASFLLGVGSGSISHEVSPAVANRYFAWYAQDDFKVTRKLTLNLGFRWDFETALTERYNRLTAVDPLARNPISDQVKMDLRGINKFAGSSLGRRNLRDIYKRAMNPRIGLAYELNAKTVIRSGYGIFFGIPAYSANYHYVGPFSGSTSWQGTQPDGVTPKYRLSNPFADGFDLPTPEGVAAAWRGFGSGWPEAMSPLYNQNWNFTIQRSLAKDLVWEIAYAGNKGTHIPIINFAPNTLFREQLAVGNELLKTVPNPFYGIIPAAAGSMAQSTVQYRQLLRPFPQFSGGIYMNPGWGNSNYHALETRLEKRFSNGFSWLVAYTWSKLLSTGQDGFWTTPWGDIRDYHCLRCDYGLSDYDQPHRFVANFTYELPIGKGKLLGGTWNRLLDSLLGQWQVNGILTLSKGLPLRFKSSQNTSYANGGAQTPDSTGKNADLGSARNIEGWFDVAQFRDPAPFTFGNINRVHPNLRQDGAAIMDASMFKRFRFTERFQAELRGEAFNVSNSPVFSSPNTTLGSSSFGLVRGTQNSPRQMQLALKVLF